MPVLLRALAVPLGLVGRPSPGRRTGDLGAPLNHTGPSVQALVEELRPETPQEKVLVEAITDVELIAALVVMVARRARFAWLDGAEVGRRESEEEFGIRR